MDYTFWLKELPDLENTHIWYPVGALATKNVKTGLLGLNLQTLLVPIGNIPADPLPSHFLNPEVVDVPELGKCFRISWHRDGDPVVFEFVDDLLRTNDFTEKPVEIFSNKLSVWRDLLNQNGLLQLNKASGLWGELYICAQNSGFVPLWTGPAGSDIDFRSDSMAFDVKTTRNKNRLSFSVSSLNQFDFPKIDVFVVWLRIEPGNETDQSLNDLLKSIDRSKLQPSVEKKLAGIFNSLPYSVQNQLTFTCRDLRVFRAVDLPIISKKILKESFGDSASRINELSYQIDCSGIEFKYLNHLINIIK
jgi:hypothetical protein